MSTRTTDQTPASEACRRIAASERNIGEHVDGPRALRDEPGHPRAHDAEWGKEEPGQNERQHAHALSQHGGAPQASLDPHHRDGHVGDGVGHGRHHEHDEQDVAVRRVRGPEHAQHEPTGDDHHHHRAQQEPTDDTPRSGGIDA